MNENPMFFYVVSLDGRWDDIDLIRVLSRDEARMAMVVLGMRVRVVVNDGKETT